ncbi:2Fe-2S iron-sulfur cluster-binding protein [Sandaracinus amylolyticus]|uniref:2Fe-2S iron-sulfur cluster-binding protein n=1 Tax=Sandaracinus amylolyticus TaxID=927083 RepID=UPI001F1E21B7|nr:2Fe-2S iron-sulfur cluster-binding protein [Sandaracinus amylolyticus]UJR83074.1 Hypothetical protein I5071_51400 [Sandaracinus amylolyticus]
MAPRRFGPSDRERVTLRVDGDDVPALRGEPIAIALAAAGRVVLGRSVKYHRPRGASCYAGRCDGCLMRVDGAPSRMTCRVPAEHGMVVETQNVLGTAEMDLLAATDWFFPGGMNHHEMFTWSKPVNRVMQSVARRIAGVGKLPDEPSAPVEPQRRECDVLVIGAGPSGLAAAAECARLGLRVIVADEETRAGGHLAHTPGVVRTAEDEAPLDARVVAERLANRAIERGAELALGCSVVAIDDEDPSVLVALADAPDALVRVEARRVIVAQGRHEGAWAFEGNDLPGVIGSDAACRLLAHGVLPGERVVIAGPTSASAPGSARLRALAAALEGAGASVIGNFEISAIERAHGRAGIDRVDVRTVGGIESLECDALVIAPPSSAVYELASQAGADVVWREGGFEVDASHDDGATRSPRVRVIGRASGVPSVPAGIAQGIAAARAIAQELQR